MGHELLADRDSADPRYLGAFYFFSRIYPPEKVECPLAVKVQFMMHRVH